MMLITKDRAYTKVSQNDQSQVHLWSTVPVIFAVSVQDIKMIPEEEIFTGDIVSANNKEITSVVRYLDHANCPSLAGDNCDVMFNSARKDSILKGLLSVR
jgi:hypothetical protein